MAHHSPEIGPSLLFHDTALRTTPPKAHFWLFETIFAVSEAMFAMFEAIFTMFEAMLAVFETIFTVCERKFAVFEAICTVFETKFAMVEAMFALLEAICAVVEEKFAGRRGDVCARRRGICGAGGRILRAARDVGGGAREVRTALTCSGSVFGQFNLS